MATVVFQWPFEQPFCIFKAPNFQIDLYPTIVNSLTMKTYPQVPKSTFQLLQKQKYGNCCILAAIFEAILDCSKTAMLVPFRNPDLDSAVIFILAITIRLFSIFKSLFHHCLLVYCIKQLTKSWNKKQANKQNNILQHHYCSS